MRRALTLAAETTALASPNPQVGCVLVRNNEILAESLPPRIIYRISPGIARSPAH